jgi:hypothetical protein
LEQDFGIPLIIKTLFLGSILPLRYERKKNQKEYLDFSRKAIRLTARVFLQRKPAYKEI